MTPMRICSCLAAAAILIAVCPAPTKAADRDSLKNLRALDVHVEELAPEAERDGLTTERVRSDIESQLMAGGLQVSEDATETFYVNVNAHRTGPGEPRYVFNVEARVSQPVMVLRMKSVMMGITWSRAIVGTADLARFPDRIRGDLRDLLTTFLQDYSAVNQKP